MIFSFLIPCEECNGTGEFEPFDPSQASTQCDCDQGNIFIVDEMESEEILKEEYPDASDIKLESVESIYAQGIQSMIKGDFQRSSECDRILERSWRNLSTSSKFSSLTPFRYSRN